MRKNKFGFELLANQVLDDLAQTICFRIAYAPQEEFYGDTPIERLFFNALDMNLKYCSQEWFRGIFLATEETLEALKARHDAKTHLIVQRQAQLPGWRVDFLIHVYADWAREPDGGTEGWKKLIVECDGHDFHERTKEQAARDRDRDRTFQLQGIDVFRFTGSELWKDPLGCSNQVIKWANRRV